MSYRLENGKMKNFVISFKSLAGKFFDEAGK